MPSKSRSILTPMQWVVLERLALGESNAAIAQALGLGMGTVRAHLSAIYQRLPLSARDGNRRVAAAAWYLGEGRRHREQGRGS